MFRFLANLFIFILGITFTIFFYLSTHRRIANSLIVSFQLLIGLGLTLNWFYYQGIEGSTSFFILLSMTVFIFGNPKTKYWPLLLGYISFAIVLIAINYLYPEMIIPYADDKSRILDLSLGFIISLSMLGYATIVLKKNLDIERFKTGEKNKELEISEARFRDFATSSGDWMWEMKIDSGYTFCSEKAEEILGYTSNEMIGKTPFDFLPQGDRNKVREEYQQIVNERKPFKNWETWTLTKMGKRVCILTSGVPVFDHRGNLVGYRGTDTDITGRKIIEKTLQESEARLSELNATKDKFFSIISHDLRNPFNAIIGFSNILADQIKAKDYEGIGEYATIIEKSSQRAMDLLLNLMEWSRLKTGRMEFNPEIIEITALIRQVTELSNDAAQQKSITISCDLPHHLTVSADKEMIGTILRNLISNAVKFTSSGGTIVITVEQKENELMVAVSDNGPGIKEEDIGKLFRIDQSYSTSGSQNEKGTGLGLILCKEFVEKHKGKIWAESNPESYLEGKGIKFCFTIPFKPLS